MNDDDARPVWPQVRYCRYEGAVFPNSEFATSEEWGIVHIPAEANPHTIMGDPLGGEEWTIRTLGSGPSWPAQAMNRLAGAIDRLTERVLTRRSKR